MDTDHTLSLPADPLLQRLNALHRRAVMSAQESALCGGICGLLLAPYREILTSGDWTHWVQNNCPFSPTSAGRYLKAAERATEALTQQLGRPAAPDEVRAALEAALESQDETQRAALIEACKSRPALPPAPPKKPRPPRPPAPPEKIAVRYVARITTAPEPIRDAIFAALLEPLTQWLAAGHSAAPLPTNPNPSTVIDKMCHGSAAKNL